MTALIHSRRASVLAGLALALGLVDPGQAHSSCTTRIGGTQGRWNLPLQANGQDTFDGTLITANIPWPSYRVQGTLTDIQTGCMSCVSGSLQGTLDDGSGPSPDYVVAGTYSGLWLNGTGQFVARIQTPGGQPVAVGEIRGKFADGPGLPGGGSFRGRFQMCD